MTDYENKQSFPPIPERQLTSERALARVERTLGSLGIRDEPMLIVGGIVLAAYGIREAQDVDIVVGPATFARLGHAGETPNGQKLSYTSHRPGVLSHHAGGYGVADLICEYDPNSSQSIAEAQETFNASLDTRAVNASGIHFSPLEEVAKRLITNPSQKNRYGHDKSKADLGKVRLYLKQYLDDTLDFDPPLPLDPETAHRILAAIDRKPGRAVLKRFSFGR